MKQLGEYVENNEYLERLHLWNNNITDSGVEILPGYLIGNTKLREVTLNGNQGITEASVPYLIEIAKKSSIHSIIANTSLISKEYVKAMRQVLDIPIEEREIPIKSNTKSAAKISTSISTSSSSSSSISAST